MTLASAHFLSAAGRAGFGLGILGSGVQQLVTGEFVRLVPRPTTTIATASSWPYSVGILLVLLGLMLVFQFKIRIAAMAGAAVFLLSFATQHVPLIVASPGLGYIWTNPLKILALAGGAILVMTRPAVGTSEGLLTVTTPWILLRWLGLVFYAVFLLVAGVQHFVYADFVVTLVPGWMPGRAFWAYFTGVALLCGGAGILTPRTVRVAGALSGVMIFLWVFLLHLPRAFADFANAGETSGVFEAVSLSGVAFLAAGVWRQDGDVRASPSTF